MLSTLHIDGMRTVHCVRAVFTSLAGVPGIERADVTIGRAELAHHSPLRFEVLREAIAAAGYVLRLVDVDGRKLPVRQPHDDGE